MKRFIKAPLSRFAPRHQLTMRAQLDQPGTTPMTNTLHRVCFQLQVKPERLDEYKARHAAVWPEMLEALSKTGWNNYSLFVRGDGLLIGYFETTSLADAQAGMAATEVNARWQADMAEFFVDLDLPPDEGFLQLTEVFNLEDQLGRSRSAD